MSRTRHVRLELLAAALVCTLSATAYAQYKNDDGDTRDKKIEEAHDTPPEHLPEGTGERGRASGGESRPLEKKPPAQDVPENAASSTRGVQIEEAHRTAPRDHSQNGDENKRE